MIEKVVSLLKSTHPIPCFAVTLFSVLFGIGIHMEPFRIALVATSVLFQQFSVGLSNDWLDFERDKTVGRNDKPSVSGKVSPILLRNASLSAGLVALILAVVLGWISAFWMVGMLIVGWAYNLGLKLNVLSVVPYAVGFGILPVFVTLSLPEPVFPPMWVIIVAALLGTSAHFANALPDLFDDRATGVRAFPHILGQRWSAVIIAVTAVSASAIVVVEADRLNPVVGLVGLILTIVLAGLASILSLRKRPPRIVFPLLMLASLVNVVLLMLGLGSLNS
jgi:4-hydroxybenzoate polyprenyltransferase